MNIKNLSINFKIRKDYNYIINNKNQKKSIKKINLGIELLRMILAILIVMVHTFRIRNEKSLLFIKKNLPYYVPSFSFIAFYFSYNTFISRNDVKIKQRFIRILIPYIGWPTIFWLRNNYIYYRYGIKKNIYLKNFYYQLLIGCGIYGIFWFLFNLLFLSLFFVIIIFLFKKYYLYILFIISILSYIFIYSKFGINFSKLYKLSLIGHSILPIPMMILYSLTGFFFSSINIIKKLYRYRITSLILFGTVLFIILYNNIIYKIKNFYRGIIINLTILSSFIFFALIPFDKINNTIIFSILKQITSYTGGIYYLHPNIFEIFEKYIISIKQKTLNGSLLLFLFCYVICLVNSFLFRKSKIKYLFN